MFRSCVLVNEKISSSNCEASSYNPRDKNTKTINCKQRRRIKQRRGNTKTLIELDHGHIKSQSLHEQMQQVCLLKIFHLWDISFIRSTVAHKSVSFRNRSATMCYPMLQQLSVMSVFISLLNESLFHQQTLQQLIKRQRKQFTNSTQKTHATHD